jgi:rod shape-determining protein MreC
LVLTLLAITLITLDARGVIALDAARNGAIDVLSPVRGAARWVTSPVRNAWNGITGYDRLREENEALRAELDEIRGQELRGEAAEAELRRLSDQLDIGYVDDIPTQLARVTTGSYSNFEDHTLQLDRGADAGLAVGNPVVTRAGLVGRIVRVTDTRSVVQLITDPDLYVGVQLPRSNLFGTGHGSGDGTSFIIDRQIDLGEPVELREPVVTGGIERSIMPVGMAIPIGTVEKITPDEANRVQIVQVAFSVDFAELSVVQVLKWVPEP